MKQYAEIIRISNQPFMIVLREVNVFITDDNAEDTKFGIKGLHQSRIYKKDPEDPDDSFVIGPFKGMYGNSGFVFSEVYEDFDWIIYGKNDSEGEVPIDLTVEIAFIDLA
jgi:hypothetical protein